MKPKSRFILSVFLMLARSVAAYPFADDFEGGLGSWVTNGMWGLTTALANSPTRSAADSPGAFYTNNTDASLVKASGMNLSGATRPAMRFYVRHELESGFDFLDVDASGNGGASWTNLTRITGNATDWRRIQLSLSPYVGMSDVRVRFRMLTDDSVVMDGVYLDDIYAGEAPASVTLLPISASQTTARLEWTASGDSAFSAYRILRALGSNPPLSAFVEVASIPSSATTSWVDIAVSPKSAYTYALAVVNNQMLESEWSVRSISTPAGMDYPFLDNGEGASGLWIAEGSWGLSTIFAFSGARAWADSPNGHYTNGQNTSLLLSAPLDLSKSTRPVLSYVHRFNLLSGDSAFVEISTNNGATWTELVAYTAASTTWQRARHELSAFRTNSQVRVRFRITTDSSGTADGWWLDDISVAEAPDRVDVGTPTEITSESMRLSWAANTNAVFSHYALVRSLAPNTGINSFEVVKLFNRATTTFVDTGLAIDSLYYYRVFAVSPYGTYSPAGEEASARTLNNPIPFTENFEGSLSRWNFTGTWGWTDAGAHSGSRALTDSPGYAYTNNSDSYAYTAVNLSGSVWPILIFWDRHELANGDSGVLEISTDGNSWSRHYCVMPSTSTNWTKRVIDLSPWRNQSNVRLRFRLMTDGSLNADGWHIDDVSVTEHTPAVARVGYTDDFEGGLTNWLNNQWRIETDEKKSGNASLGDGLPGDVLNNASWWLVLNGPLDLSGMSDPQLTLWLKGNLDGWGGWPYPSTWFRVQVSKNNGLNWDEVVGQGYYWNANWTRYQASLPAGYTVANVRVRMEVGGSSSGYANWQSLNIWVDRFSVMARPTGVVFQAPAPGLKTVGLSWAASGLGSAFKSYEVYRSLDSTVDLSDTRIGSFTNIGTTSMTDTGLEIGRTYYYGIYVVNDWDVYSSVSTASAMTQPLNALNDPMESLENWVYTGSWGVDTQRFRSGSGSLADSPVGAYTNSGDSYIMTSVNLLGMGMSWPVLTFWDRHELANGDSGVLEISTDGNSWSRHYCVMPSTSTNWTKRVIDLSPWRNQSNVRLRFRLLTDGSLNADGWHIDDVSVTEHTPAAPRAGLMEDFEGGLTNWLNNQWRIETDEKKSGNASLGDGLPGDVLNNASWWLVLNGPLDLSGMSDPQLTLWLKGNLDGWGGWPYPSTWFRVQVSKNNGLNWDNVVGQGYYWNANWTRYQASLPAGYTVANVRVRMEVGGSSSGYANWQSLNIWVDRFSVMARPTGVVFQAPAPGLKTVGLSWAASGLGSAFKSYEVYRSLDSTVDLSDTRIGSFTNIGTTSMTDTGLEIGRTYYYGIYVVNDWDVYSSVSTASAMTQPLNALNDPMESLENWVYTGSWGVDTQRFRSGSGSLADSPVGAYTNSGDSYIMTSVNLLGMGMSWPVLTFWDRHELANGDSGVLEISTDGNSWSRHYCVMPSTSTNWTKRVIDLSPWRNQSNVRLRFRLMTDGSLNADGWHIDDVSVTEHTPAVARVGYTDDFEGGLTNWLNNQWRIETDEKKSGNASLGDGLPGDVLNNASWWLVLNGPLDVSGMSDPQLTLWLKGNLDGWGGWPYPSTWFRVQVSKNNGLNWDEVVGQGYYWNANWTRYQASLPAGYTVANVRVRMEVGGSSSGYANWQSLNIWVDRFSVMARPTGVVFQAPAPGLKTVGLSWAASGLGSAFKSYEVYRSLDSTVDLSDTRIGSFTNIGTTSMTDTGLEIGRTYYYGIYVVNDWDVYSSVSTASAMTQPLNALNDPMESLENWVYTGSWGVDTQRFRSGSGSLADSPVGAYTNSGDSYIMTSVNLLGMGMNWPVLTFWDRHELANGDSGVLEISTDGNSWSRHYCAMPSTSTNWTKRVIDLSPWRNQSNVRLRFRLLTDASLNADGWHIDDVSVTNNISGPALTGFFDGFEGSLNSWLNSQWRTVADNVYAGSSALGDGLPTDEINNAAISLVLNSTLDLSGVSNPSLTYFLKGFLYAHGGWPYPNSALRVQLSNNGGLDWSDLDVQASWWSNDWTRRQVSIPAAFRTNNVRVRIQASGGSSGNAMWIPLNIWVDNFGIGGPAPAAPAPISPAQYESVGVLRPTLVIANAQDFQSDPLTYRFEVYRDAGLTNIVALVPALASGATSTSWQVDVNLDNNAQYWWRCRASDGSNVGPWSATFTFYVNETNSPPFMVQVAGPPKGATLRTASGILSWYPATDADVGDEIVQYHIQIDDDPAFAAPEVSDIFAAPIPPPQGPYVTISRPLYTFSGYELLGMISNYFWRIRARDSRFAWSPWSVGGHWFIYGVPPPNAANVVRNANGTITFTWDVGTENWYIQWTPSLTGGWQTVAGPLGVNSWTFTPNPTQTSGFYRIAGE